MEEMDRFGLTEEEQMLQDMVRRLAKEKVAPGAEERDKKGEYPVRHARTHEGKRPHGCRFPPRNTMVWPLA